MLSCLQRGPGGGWNSRRWGRRELYQVLLCHHQNDSALRWAAMRDALMFHPLWRNKVAIRQRPWGRGHCYFWRERTQKAQAELNQTHICLLAKISTLGQTSPHQDNLFFRLFLWPILFLQFSTASSTSLLPLAQSYYNPFLHTSQNLFLQVMILHEKEKQCNAANNSN